MFAIAEKISAQQVYNNEYRVLSVLDCHTTAINKSGWNQSVFEIKEHVNVGDSINDNGKIWKSE